jgi:hypothetical protein
VGGLRCQAAIAGEGRHLIGPPQPVMLPAWHQRYGQRIDLLIRSEYGLPVAVVTCNHSPHLHADPVSDLPCMQPFLSPLVTCPVTDHEKLQRWAAYLPFCVTLASIGPDNSFQGIACEARITSEFGVCGSPTK